MAYRKQLKVAFDNRVDFYSVPNSVIVPPSIAGGRRQGGWMDEKTKLLGQKCSLGVSKLNVLLEASAKIATSLASHTLCREDGSGHTVTNELLPRQKLDATNQIRALRRSHLLSWSTITSQRV